MFVSSSSLASGSPVRVAARRPGSRLAVSSGNGRGRSPASKALSGSDWTARRSQRPNRRRTRPRRSAGPGCPLSRTNDWVVGPHEGNPTPGQQRSAQGCVCVPAGRRSLGAGVLPPPPPGQLGSRAMSPASVGWPVAGLMVSTVAVTRPLPLVRLYAARTRAGIADRLPRRRLPRGSLIVTPSAVGKNCGFRTREEN